MVEWNVTWELPLKNALKCLTITRVIYLQRCSVPNTTPSSPGPTASCPPCTHRSLLLKQPLLCPRSRSRMWQRCPTQQTAQMTSAGLCSWCSLGWGEAWQSPWLSLHFFSSLPEVKKSPIWGFRRVRGVRGTGPCVLLQLAINRGYGEDPAGTGMGQ